MTVATSGTRSEQEWATSSIAFGVASTSRATPSCWEEPGDGGRRRRQLSASDCTRMRSRRRAATAGRRVGGGPSSRSRRRDFAIDHASPRSCSGRPKGDEAAVAACDARDAAMVLTGGGTSALTAAPGRARARQNGEGAGRPSLLPAPPFRRLAVPASATRRCRGRRPPATTARRLRGLSPSRRRRHPLRRRRASATFCRPAAAGTRSSTRAPRRRSRGR